jgi:CRP/FNR family cyclic AMP-dependent transcriptional regulator
MEILPELLSKIPVFAALESQELDRLVKIAVMRRLPKGSKLALQGEVWPYLFLVAEGELEAVKGSLEGRNLLVTTFLTGELFWGSAFFQDDSPQLATLEACVPSSVFMWSQREIKPVFLAHGQVGWELCLMMIRRMQRASAIVDDLAFQSVSGRLAHLLLDHFDSAGEQAVERSLTLDEMAVRIGTTREMVCRVLYRFADKKLINVTRTEFMLTNRPGLARLVDGS